MFWADLTGLIKISCTGGTSFPFPIFTTLLCCYTLLWHSCDSMATFILGVIPSHTVHSTCSASTVTGVKMLQHLFFTCHPLCNETVRHRAAEDVPVQHSLWKEDAFFCGQEKSCSFFCWNLWAVGAKTSDVFIFLSCVYYDIWQGCKMTCTVISKPPNSCGQGPIQFNGTF